MRRAIDAAENRRAELLARCAAEREALAARVRFVRAAAPAAALARRGAGLFAGQPLGVLAATAVLAMLVRRARLRHWAGLIGVALPLAMRLLRAWQDGASVSRR